MRTILAALLCLAPAVASAQPCTVSVTTKPGTYANGDAKVTTRWPKACPAPVKGDSLTVDATRTIQSTPETFAIDLTKAIEAAQSGPATLILALGAYQVNLVLPRTAYGITFTAAILPAARTRVTPVAILPRLVPMQAGSPTITVQGDRYVFRGLQIDCPGVGVTCVDLDVAAMPRDVTFDQVLIRGSEMIGGHRGIAANGINVAITNSWIDRMWEVGRDSQAIAIWDAPGPLRVENNYLEASGENFLLGGAVPTCACVPTDVTFTRNTVAKDPKWRMMDPQPQVKNLLELKYGRKVTITDNTFQYNWAQAQTGWSILFTTMGIEGTPWTVLEDVTFTGNRISDIANGLNVAAVTGPVRRINAHDNVWDRIDADKWAGDGRWAMVLTGTAGIEDLTIEHETVRGLTGNMFLGLYGDVPLRRFVLTHVITEHRDYGVHSSDGLAIDALKVMAPDAVFRDNAILGPEASWLMWPAGNFAIDVPLADQFNGDVLKAESPLRTLATSDGVTMGARR